MVRVVKTFQVQTQPLEDGTSLLTVPMIALDLSVYPQVRSVFVRARGKAPSAATPAFFTVRDLDRPAHGLPYYNMVRSFPVTTDASFTDLLTPDIKSIITNGNRITVVPEGVDAPNGAILEDFHVIVNVEEDEGYLHPGDTFRNRTVHPGMDINGKTLYPGQTKPEGFSFLDTFVNLAAPVNGEGEALTDPFDRQDLSPEIYYRHDSNFWGGSTSFILEATGLIDADQFATTPASYEVVLWDVAANAPVVGSEVTIDFNVQEIARSAAFQGIEHGREYKVRWRNANAPSEGDLHLDRVSLVIRQTAANIGSTADFYSVRTKPIVDQAFDFGGYSVWVPESTEAVALDHYWEATVVGDGANVTSLALTDDASNIYGLITAVVATPFRYRVSASGLPTAQRVDPLRSSHITAGTATYADARWITVSRLATQNLDYSLTGAYRIAFSDRSFSVDGAYRILPVNSILVDGTYRIRSGNRAFSLPGRYHVDASDRTFTRDGVYRVKVGAKTYARDGTFFVARADKTFARAAEYRIGHPNQAFARDGLYYVFRTASFARDGVYEIVRRFDRAAEYRVRVPDLTVSRSGAYVVKGHNATFSRDGEFRIERTRSFARSGLYRIEVERSFSRSGTYRLGFAQSFTRDGEFRVLRTNCTFARSGTYRVGIDAKTFTRDGAYRIGPFARSTSRDGEYRIGHTNRSVARVGIYRVARFDLALSRSGAYVVSLAQSFSRDGAYRVFRARRIFARVGSYRIEVPDHSLRRVGRYAVKRVDLTLSRDGAYAITSLTLRLRTPVHSLTVHRTPVTSVLETAMPVREILVLSTPVG